MNKHSIPSSRDLTVNHLIQLIKESNDNGARFCFILGSGASVESGIISGTELEKIWMDCIMGKADDLPAKKKIPEESRKLAKAMKDKNLLKNDFSDIEAAWGECCRDSKKRMPSEYYFDIYKLRFYPDEANGYRYLEKKMEGKDPSIGYHSLSRMLTKDNQNNLVITTNFDSLVEDALSIFTEKKPLVVGHESLAGFISSDIQRPIIAKIHRSVFYNPFNTPETTDHLSEEWKEALRIAFHIYTPIVVGYGGGDGSLMAFLEDDTTSFRHGIYWCYRESDEINQRIIDLVEKKKGFFVKIEGFDALMLRIGQEFYPSLITPTNTQKQLQERANHRIETYNKQWDTLSKNKYLSQIVSSINLNEKEKVEVRQKEGKLTYWDHMRKADRASNNNKYEEAIHEYSEAILLQPDQAIAYNNRGVTHCNHKEYTAAIEDFSTAIIINPDYAQAYNNRGFTYGEMKLYDKAIDDLSRAIGCDPNLVEAYNNLGAIYEEKEQYDIAIINYKKAIELNRKDADLRRRLGNIYFKQGELSKALEELSLAIELKADDVDAFVIRAKVYHRMGKHEKAEQDEKTAEKIKNSKNKGPQSKS